MAIHEPSVPPMKVWVRREFLYDEQSHHCEWDRGVMISVRYIPGQAALFQVLLEKCKWKVTRCSVYLVVFT